jgi:signal transduction histidine kinase
MTPSPRPSARALLVALGAAFCSGVLVRLGRSTTWYVRRRALRLEAEREEQLEQTRAAERRRIAGEMHDVLAHRLSLLSLQAGALELRPDAPADEAAQCAAIRTSAATAFEELRDVMAVLRGDRGDWAGAPQPTLAQVPALLETYRSAGVDVRAQVDVPETGALRDSVGRTAYRVVEEGLRNARKHAPGSRVQVRVSVADPARLQVEVVSGAPSGGLHANGRPGSGLVGLSERLALVGGRLEHGPDPDGNFVLRAILPWT